jgi:hypothetical protein
VVEEAGVPGENTDHGQATGKLYHLRMRVECTLFVIYKYDANPSRNAESGVKRINQIKSNLGGFVYIVLCNWCISWVTVTLTHISAEDGVYCRDNIILQLSIK